MPSCVVGEAELLLAAEHPLARDAADVARGAIVMSFAGQVRAERREHDEPAGLGHVRRAAHDLLLCRRRDRP